MTVPLPTASTRWRCTLCGNLPRFDVTRSSKVVEYVHLDLAGEPKVEEREVVSETIESVRCRWCNAVDQIELVDRPGTDAATASCGRPPSGTDDSWGDGLWSMQAALNRPLRPVTAPPRCSTARC